MKVNCSGSSAWGDWPLVIRTTDIIEFLEVLAILRFRNEGVRKAKDQSQGGPLFFLFVVHPLLTLLTTVTGSKEELSTLCKAGEEQGEWLRQQQRSDTAFLIYTTVQYTRKISTNMTTIFSYFDDRHNTNLLKVSVNLYKI